VVAGGVAAALLVPRGNERRPAPRPAYATAPVVRGKVSTELAVAGTLQFARQRTISAGMAGVVTKLPAAGARITFGQTLYVVGMQPVLLLRGSVPMWRDFKAKMPAGPDVRQLEAGLRALGVFAGTVDNRFTWYTLDAIKRLQRRVGVKPTGVLARGTIRFGASPVRVAARQTALGAQLAVGSAVLRVSSARKVVHADVKLADRRLAARGTAVTVALPGGTTAKGHVAGTGPAVERRQDDGNSTAIVVPATIALDEQRRVREFQRAPVTVRFPAAARRDVLSVPVEALVALSDSRFAVEIPAAHGATTRVPVKTGLFAAGRVEISGRGIRPGLAVVVPR
jgi:peptidoglycan hydrolase-like protein with peptidoglycan-binding domain